jgi:uncharacterized protein YkwD
VATSVALNRKLRLLLIVSALLCLTPSPASAIGEGRLIAPTAECPGQENLQAPVEVQVRTMRCMTNFARQRVDLSSLAPSSSLDRSAGDKARDILRCDSFSHVACGREFTFWMRRTGYLSDRCWNVGENLAWGTAAMGTARAIFQAWMRSPSHRTNILGAFREMGLSLRTGTLEGRTGTRVWTAHFGAHHCA